MRKTKQIIILQIVLVLIFSALVLMSCGGKDEPLPPEKLTAPVVVLNGDVVAWSSNPLADKFEISLDGNLSYIENSVTSKKLVGGQSFKIRAIGDGTNYANSDWSNSVTCEKKHTVIWKNGDAILETDTEVSDGAIPKYDGEEPTKAADAQYSYDFIGWEPAVVAATEDVTYVAVFSSKLNKYTVTWKNGDVELETDRDVEYGTLPAYNGETPQKADDMDTYKFVGWSPAISEVVGNVTYVAQFEPIGGGFTIVWKNGDVVLEIDQNVALGSNPHYDGATPVKESNAQYTYEFSGWSPQLETVTGAVTYQAQFSEKIRTYTVTFYSEDGLTILETAVVKYGDRVTYSKPEPVKNATEGYTYVFEKWVTAQGEDATDDFSNVTKDVAVYASFKRIPRTVTVNIVSSNIDYGTVSLGELKGIPYGTEILVDGNDIVINGQSIIAQAKAATDQYTYLFLGWTADATVGNDTIITANFSRSVNAYTITWKNGDEILELDKNVMYGTTPVYNGIQPTKESDGEHSYVFSGWSPSISSVTGDVTYVAQFDNTIGKHTVIFYDDDGKTELGRVIVEHGKNAIYPNSLPTKKPTAQVVYTFEKWVTDKGGETEAVLLNITEDKSVYAKYSSKTRMYTVTFCDYNGTILSQAEVPYGGSAELPENPAREGHRFTGWDKTYSNITDDITVKATYVQCFVVEFVDYDDSIIDVQMVDYKGSAIAPQKPTRNNYRFVGWNTVFNNVVHDLTVKAEYVRQYKVTFVDYDGTVLKEATMVDAGLSAEAPSNPNREGYNFSGWDKSFEDISSDLTVAATYTVKTYTVTFKMPNGTVIGDPQTVKYGEDAVAPMYSDEFIKGKIIYLDDFEGFTKIYFNENNTVSYFSGWSETLKDVKENRVIYAEYEESYEQPVIFVEQNGNTLRFQMYCPENCYIYGLEFGFGWENSGNISDCVEELGSNRDAEYNNDDKTFRYIMFDGYGITSQSNYFDVATITFSSAHGFVLNVDDISFLTNYSIIFGGKSKVDVDELVKITPIIVVK